MFYGAFAHREQSAPDKYRSRAGEFDFHNASRQSYPQLPAGFGATACHHFMYIVDGGPARISRCPPATGAALCSQTNIRLRTPLFPAKPVSHRPASVA